MEKYLYQDLYELEEKHWWHLAKRQIVRNLIKKTLNKRGQKILDIGCGTGKNLEMLKEFGNVWGIDNSWQAINFCKRRGFKRIKMASAEKTDMDTDSFDLVVLLDVLEHTDDKKSLVEIKRILKVQGILVITVPAFQWLWSLWDEVLHHKRRYFKKDIKKLLDSEGFEILKISYFFSYLLIPILIVRFVKKRIHKSQYPSDFQLSFPIISTIFKILSTIESWLIQYFDIPLGTSIICIASKKK